jgi:hypothetical protein
VIPRSCSTLLEHEPVEMSSDAKLGERRPVCRGRVPSGRSTRRGCADG